MAEDAIPSYETSPSEPPTYSRVPLEDEQTLAITLRPGATNPRHGTHVKCFKEAIVIFKDQDERVSSPTYSRGGLVHGEVGLSTTEDVIEVTVKLFGHLSVMSSEYGSSGATLVSHKQSLWSGKGNSCPSILPFSIRLPSTYMAQDGSSRLPPSFEASFMTMPAFFVKCFYTMNITIIKMRRRRFASWSVSKTVSIVLNHRPRTRPQRPFVVVDSVFSSLKPVPEEWMQVVVTMEVRSESTATPVVCHLLIPSVQTFAITDAIPFHVQLCSSLESLQELIPPNSCLLYPEKDGPSESSGPAGLQVRLVRQIRVEINGQKRTRTMTIGTSRLSPVPPALNENNPPNEICLDWQGEAKCRDDVTCGGFHAGGLFVKDFIVLDLTPSLERESFLLPVQLNQPIRLVTDSCPDAIYDGVHPLDT